MPLSRYSIRNEYSLADPELYRAADKDDPEAMLEGVAMAGLVGVLRQLGDLAEFAAEIFHDLHEDLMATAARGHGLTVRVQQIEAEFPSIEKTFLSQARHSSFFYNTGIDWHPNVHMDQNLVTQGDLPRFVMDSYEECRGPPRLFLLDKFDVAGTGSCLKRYTDPSFFKGESPLSAMPSAEVQREKKSRKSKKKGSHWRNAETPEVLSTSHVKLQQLLLEERVENNISDPARRVKLKRRLNGSPFDSGMGKSYMDAILKIRTPDPDVVGEISITSSPLKILASVAGETGNEVLDIPAIISPGKKTQQRKRNMFSSSDSESGNKPFIHALTEEYSRISPNFTSTQMDNVHSTPHEVDKREIVAERVRKLDGYQSDDEVDNYVDALTTMDSKMETDSEYRAKKDTHLFNVNGRRMGSDATEELSDIQTHSTDCQSIKSSSLIDGGNSSSRKGKSSFSYSGSFDLAEKAQSEEGDSAKATISGEYREAEIVNSSSDRYSLNGNTPSTQTPRHIIQDYACNENANISSCKSEVGESSSSSCLIDLGTVLLPGDPGEHFMKFSLLGPEVEEISSNHSNLNAGCVENEKKSIHVGKNIPWTSNYNDRPSRTEDAGFSNLSPNSMDELNDQEKHKSHTFLHLPSVLQLASDNNSNEDLTNDIMRGEFMDKEHAFTSVASPLQSAVTLSSQKEEFAEREHETCSPCANSEGNISEETASRYSLTLDCLETADLVEIPLQRSENGHSLDPGVYFSHDRELEIDGTSSSKVDGEEMNGLSFHNDLVQKDNDYFSSVSDIRSFPDSPHAVDASLDDGIKGAIHLQAKDVAIVADTNLINNESDATSLDTKSMKLQGKCSLFFQDLRQNGMKFEEEYIHESSMKEMVNEQAHVSSELESFSSKTLRCDDRSDLDLLHCVSDSFSGENSRNSSHVNNGSAGMSSYQNTEDAEAKSLQKINVIDKEEDAQRSPTRHLAEMSISQGLQVKLCNGQFDAQSSHDQVSESDSSQHTVFVEDTENILSLPTAHPAEVSTPLDQKVESHNGNLDVISCHVTHDQVPESKHVHQTEALVEEEGISSPTHRVAELRILVQENFELHNNQFDLESRYDQVSQLTSSQHIDFIENAENSISSPTHHKAELTASQQQTDESLRATFYTEPCQRQDSDSESFQHLNARGKEEDSVSPFTHDTTELKPCMEQKVEFQNNQLDVKSWHDQSVELDHAEQIKVNESSETDVYSDTHFIDSSETAVSSGSHFITELICPIDQTPELEDHFDEKSRHTNNASVDPLSQIRQAESSIPNFQDRERSPSSEISAVHLSSQPPLPHLLPQFSVSKPAEDPLRSNFTTFDLLPEASLDEMPPLPPLPPMQWRLEEVPQMFPAPEGNMLGHTLHSVPPLMSASDNKYQSCHPETDAGSSYPSNPFSRHSSLEHHDSQDMNANQADFVVHSVDPVLRQVPDLVTIASRVLVTTSGLVLPMDHSVKREDVLHDSERGKIYHDMNPFSPLTTVDDTSSALPSCSFAEKTVKPLSQSAPSTSSKLEDSFQGEAILSEEKTMPTTGISLPVIHVYEKQPILSTSGEEATWTSSSSLSLAPSEDGMPNGNEKIKLPRPRNPLIDAVVAHDKSKLRKVTQLPQPQIGQKAEERDSLLEQIRAKSFNLKPAVVTRPSIQGPKTNLRLAAILEKANAIRQAFAGTGSDEDDDEDAWSDS